MKKKQSVPSTEYPQAQARRFPVPGLELGLSTSIPRGTEYDLEECCHRSPFFGCRGEEQTFKVTKKGNCP